MSLFDIDSLELNLKQLEEITFKEGFWNSNSLEEKKEINKVLNEIKEIKFKYNKFKDLEKKYMELSDFVELIEIEFDEELVHEFEKNDKLFFHDLEKFKIELLLSRTI